LFVTNADRDHISDLNNLWFEGIAVSTSIRIGNFTINTEFYG